ncbi:MAG: DNA-3-methyladenine glycosylase [Minisyncoccales bacterium]
MKERIKKDFFLQSSSIVGKKILGKDLVRKLNNGKERRGKIVEIEIYKGPEDKAAHTCNGKTKRNRVVWRRGGFLYIYLIYGIHFMLNISTSQKGNPECILIRAIDSKNVSFKKTNGPGKLTKYLKIDKKFYGEDLSKSKKIWIEGKDKKEKIEKSVRINIDYAGRYWANKKWRFFIKKYEKGLPKP